MRTDIQIHDPSDGVALASLAALHRNPFVGGAYRAEKLGKRRSAPRGIILHTTGGGLARAVEGQAPDSDAAAARRYTTGALRYYGHYLVGRIDGRIYQLAHPVRIAHHTGALASKYGRGPTAPSDAWRRFGSPIGVEGWAPHGRDPAEVYDWWDARWPGITSPVEFFGRQVNAATLGLDVIPAVDGSFGGDQVEATAQLVAALCATYDIEPTERGVMRHEDVDPVRRGCVLRRGTIYGVPWDPGPRFPFDAMLERVRQLLDGGWC